MSEPTSVLKNRSFVGHIGAQFFGAFNDNLFKQLVLFLAATELFPNEDKQGLAFAVFALPFIIFSGLAGDLSEKLSKRRIVVAMKVLEVGIMVAGAVALQVKSWPLMLLVLFVMGTQSAFFGPAKYGVIPELVDDRNLLKANGLITMTTFMAILFGQATAGPLLDGFGSALWITGAVCTGFSAIGLASARRIKPLLPQSPELVISKNPFSGIWGSIKELGKDKRVVPVLLLNSIFWFNGGVIQQGITGLGGPEMLNIHENKTLISLLLVTLATSIMIGAVLVPVFEKRVKRSSMILVGGLGMVGAQWALFAAVTTLGEDAYIPAHIILALLGFLGAFFAVPIQTFLQDAPPEGARGKAFAVNNFLNFIFIFLAGAFYMGTSAANLNAGLSIGLAGACMAAMVLWRFKIIRQVDD